MADKEKKPRLIDGTVPRFLLVGVINTLVGCGAMFLLYNAAHWSYWASSAANYVLGGVVSFFLNKYFTFRRREWSWRQVVRFAVNVAVCWLLAYGLAKPLVLRLLAGEDVDDLWPQLQALPSQEKWAFTAFPMSMVFSVQPSRSARSPPSPARQ